MAGFDPAIHCATAQDFEMDGGLEAGHDKKVQYGIFRFV
jgi:hypothetical protein